MDESGSTQIKPTAPQTLTPSAYNNRYGHVINAYNSVNRTDTQKKYDMLNRQRDAYLRAVDARKNAPNLSSDKGKATNLARNLREQLKEQYAQVYGSDAGFGRWLTSGVQTGLMGFANGVYQTAGMVEDTITNAANKAYWTLNYGSNPDRWMKSYYGDNPDEDDPMYKVYTAYKNAQAARKGGGAFSGVSGDTWKSAEEQLRDRLEQMYRERVNDDNLFDPNGGLFHEIADYSNETYKETQAWNELQNEFQKTASSGNGKGWDIANQLVIGTAQAVPYAAFGMLGAAGAGGEIGAQLAPQTTSILEKVASTIQGYVKDPNYWLAFSQETGNTYREALDAGANQDTAALTATMVGLINGAVELGLGGGNAGIQDLPERLMKSGKGTRKAVQEWIESAVSEGKEEVIQGVISNLAEKIGYNRSKAWLGEGGVIDPMALAQEGFMGMAVGGILGGGQSLGVGMINRAAQNRADEANANLGKKYADKADTILDNALSMPEVTRSYKLAREIQAETEKNGTAPTDTQIGALYRAMMADTGYNETNRSELIRKATERLNELGETTDSRQVAEVIAKAADGYRLNNAEKKILNNSDNGLRVYNEYLNAFDRTFTAEWSEQTKREQAVRYAQAAPDLTQEEKVDTSRKIENPDALTTQELREAIDNLSEKYGEQANVFKEAAKAVDGTDIYYFDDAYHTVYQLAKSGLAESTIRKDVKTSWLSPAAFKVAYNAGQDAQTFKAGTRYNPNATLKLNGINYKSLNNKQRASVRALMEIARVTGINIELFDSTTANGMLGNEQGSYSNGKIRIDINAGMLDKGDILNVAMLRTASHELTHYIQQNNKDAYKELKDFVFDKLQVSMFSDGKYKDADTWIRAKMETLGMEDNAKNYGIASDEVVADACEMMLKDSTAFETLAKEKPTLARRLLDWLKGLIADIKKAFSGVEAASTEARAMVDSMEELQQKWDAALVGAVENTKRNEAIDSISSPELQNSLRYDTQYMDKAMQMNSIVPQDVMDAAKTARETIAEKFLDPDVQDALGLPPDVIGNTYIPNGSYDGTEENTTVCVRSMAVDALMDAVAEKLGRPLTVEDTIAISQEYWKYTDTPECLYCYVAMDRKAYREYLGSYLQQRDDVIENIKNGMSRDEAYEKFLDGRKDTKQMQRRFSMWLTNYNKGAATITLADLASDANMQAAVERDSSLEVQINDARKYAQSASWAKKRIGYRAYNNHILKWAKSRIDNLNKHYGLRMYSFSDYSPAFILENMQMITDAAVRGLKMLAYTKELDFVKIFAPTGMNINISVFGHQKNGMISQDAMQGADWKEAQKLRKKYGNVGITFVATNDEQIEWAMAQDWVDVVIPFHLVRTGAKVADAFKWTNYSGMQADVKTKAWKSGNAKSIYPSEHHNDKAAYLAALEENGLSPRFAKWLDNPNYMKLVNETRRSADETPIVQPIFNTDAALKSIETMRKKGGYYVPIGGTNEEMHDIAAEIAETLPEDVQYSRRVTPEQDERYMELAKDPQKNEAELREMVEQAARAAGYNSPLLYHGSDAFGFTRIDTAAPGGDKFSFWAANRKDVSATYTRYGKTRGVSEQMSDDAIERMIDDADHELNRAIDDFRSIIDYYFTEWALGQDGNSYLEKLVRKANPEPGYGDGVYDELLEIVADIYDDYRDEFQNEFGEEYEDFADWQDNSTAWSNIEGYIDVVEGKYSKLADIEHGNTNGGIYELYANTSNMLDIDAKGALWNNLQPSIEGDTNLGHNTRSVAKWAYEHKYDGVIFRNIKDNGNYGRTNESDVYTFFKPTSQVKSADPVTYDDSGNVIPLSERFNEENEDIRYQLREQGLSAREVLSSALTDIAETDAERSKLISYQRAVKSLDETQAQLDDIRSQIHDIMFTKGSDRSKLKSLETQKAQIEKKLDWWDKRLMSLQNTAPLKAVLNRERARVRKQTRAEVMENVREKRETSAVRKSIKSMMEKWNSKLQVNGPNKNIPAPFAKTIAELSQALDLTSGRPLSEKAVDKLNKLKSVYDIVMNDEDYKTLQDPVTKMYLDNAIDAINNTPLRQMGREQLESLYDAMKCINSVMFEANRLRDKAYRRDTAETGQAMIMDTDEAIAPKWKFWRDYETWQLTPDRFFAMLGGWKKGSAWEQVAASFKEGTRRTIRYERDFYNTFRAFTEAPEIDRLTNPNKLIDIGLMDRNGKPVKITRGMMLSIYMHLLAEDNRRAILYGGLNVPVLKEYYGQKIASSYTTGHENVVGILEDMTKLSEQIYQISNDESLSEEERQKKIEAIGEQQDKLEAEGYDRLDALKNRIYDEMTDFEKKLTETATYWNDVKSAGYINEVTMEMYQIKRARVKNYWAIHRDTSFVKTDFESIAKNMNLSNVGWLKDRVKSAAPVLLTDFVYELDNSCKRVATFYGYSIAQADFNKLYNYKLPGVNKSVKNAVMSKFGGGSKSFGVTADQYVENFIGDVVGSRVKPDTTIWAAIRRNLPRASLTLNPRVALSQIASVPTAAAEVGWGAMAKGFIRGLPTAFNKNAKEQLMQKDEYFFQRYRGDGSMREFADMKSGNNVIDKLWNKADKLTKHALLNWCQNCDVFATATMWAMAEEWVKANTNLTGEAFDAAVKQKYDDIITKTQPNYTTAERSDLLRDTREAYKFLTMYKTQSNQNFNILKEANARLRKTASDLKNGRNGVTQADLKQARKQFANAYSAVMLGGTLAFVALRAIANAILGHMNDYRDDEDEITKASVLNGITVACMQSMANMFVLGSEVEALVEKSITGKKYYGLEDTALASANNVLKQFQTLAVAYATGETDNIGAKWAKLTQNAAQIVGLPYSSVKTFIEAGKTWAADIERGTFGSFEGGVTRSNSVNYNRLYKALEDGDTAKAERIREEIRRNSPDIEDKTIESGLRGVIKDMWEEGTITTSEAVDKIVEYTGKDPDTAYWDVQKWANKANAEDDEKYTDSNYYRLWQVIDNDGDAEAAMSELLEHGKDADQIAQDVRKHIKDAYTNGEITDTQARERLLKYDQHKVDKQLVPYTKAEVDKLVNGWVTSNTLGWDYDDKETLYAKGEISKSELKKALVDIGGMSSEKADQRIEIMDWNKEGYAVENDKYDSIIGKYNRELKSKGVSKSIWYNYYVFQSQTSGEVDANGKSIPYSKMVKLFDYIGKLNITSDQKMALARTYTDSESSIAKYKTW